MQNQYGFIFQFCMSLHAEVADYSCSGQMLKNTPIPYLILDFPIPND